MPDDLDNYDGRDFTEDERKQIRKLLENERHMTWMWGSIRVWIGYVATTIAAIYAFYLAVKEHIPWVLKKF